MQQISQSICNFNNLIQLTMKTNSLVTSVNNKKSLTIRAYYQFYIIQLVYYIYIEKYVNKITTTCFRYVHLSLLNTSSIFVKCSCKYFKARPTVSSILIFLLILFPLREENSTLFVRDFFSISKIFTFRYITEFLFQGSLEIRQKLIDTSVVSVHLSGTSGGEITGN